MAKRPIFSLRWTLAALAIVVVAGGIAGFFFATTPAASIGNVNTDADGVAIHGYDTVAYFVDGKPMKGDPAHEHVWEGARWHFANAGNRDLFAANPNRYAPRYGGFCSMGLAMGEKSDVDPEQWTIVDGKLYLNKAKWVQDKWRAAPDAYIVTSEINWAKHRDNLRINDSLR